MAFCDCKDVDGTRPVLPTCIEIKMPKEVVTGRRDQSPIGKTTYPRLYMCKTVLKCKPTGVLKKKAKKKTHKKKMVQSSYVRKNLGVVKKIAT